MQWSDQQHAIFQWFESGKVGVRGKKVKKAQHLIVRARAGTGKTTTIVQAVRYAPEASILLCAFNKRIATELQNRLRQSNPAAKAQTLHSVGFQLVGRYWERIRVDDRNQRARSLTEAVCGDQSPDAIKRLVTKLHTKGREIVPHARKVGDLTELLYQFECDPDETWVRSGFDAGYVEQKALAAMELAATRKPVDTGIDFADMIYLPVRNRWLMKMYDLVVVDEAQDMTTSQLELAQGVCAGRFCLVGDDRQAIYAFRGADSNSLDRLKTELQAAELGLTVTYRCGAAIVDYAKTLVPDFSAGPNNPAGEIVTLAESKLTDDVRYGDFVLSRINAPLASIAMALIRKQKRVRIAGKDIGRGLRDLIRDLGRDQPQLPEFLRRLDEWAEREVAKAIKAKRDERVEQIHDRVQTLEVLCEGKVSLREVEAVIDSLFSDEVGEKDYVTCSSVHKAKGLEADRVYVVKETLYPQRKPRNGKKKTDAQLALAAREEQNIEYVAVTRAKQTLVWVQSVVAVPPPPAPAPIDQTVEASTLGLPAGTWPERLTFDGVEYQQHSTSRRGGELLYVRYASADGRTLTVLND